MMGFSIRVQGGTGLIESTDTEHNGSKIHSSKNTLTLNIEQINNEQSLKNRIFDITISI